MVMTVLQCDDYRVGPSTSLAGDLADGNPPWVNFLRWSSLESRGERRTSEWEGAGAAYGHRQAKK